MKTRIITKQVFVSPFELSLEDVKEFQQLFLQESGINISSETAKAYAIELLLVVKACFKPIPKEYAK